ncbi:MAG: RteC domain-containing protein [Bacteroidota bacterium]
MQQELLDARALALPMEQEIESCFEICNRYLSDINSLNVEESEKVYFHKNILPLFIAECEYCTLLSYSRLFRPSDNVEEQLGFWQREGNRLAKFEEKHKSFLEYYQSSRTDKDELYFSTPSNEYGAIISGYLSLKKYNSYVAEELAVLSEFMVKEPVFVKPAPVSRDKKIINIARSIMIMNFIK